MASTSVLKLKVDDKEYNASLKQAQQGMLNLEQSLKNAGKTFTQVDKSVVDYVRSIGNMETQSKTASGSMAELKRTFTELSLQYNRLTDQERESPFGKALSQSLDELAPRIRKAKAEIEDINKKMTGVSAPSVGGGMFSGLGDKMSGMLQVFGGNMLTKAAGAVANLGSEMLESIHQGVELARQGEGIRIAFERLGRGDILDGLREATHGTVTDIELMKAAVKFNDFKLPVEELGTMLAFAQQKAKDTGQSVDYMVDSIVTGLGRKSLMILDNLGLSAAEIKDKMAETGDMTKAVGAIIREQMSKAGDYVETAADRAAQANVSLQNKMEELGRKFAPLEEASNSLWASMKIGILDIIGGPLTDLLNKLTEAGRMMSAYGKMGGNGKVGRMIANIAGASEQNRQSIYQQQQQQFWKYINPREQQLKDIRAWQSGQRGEALGNRISAITEKYGSLDATKIQADVDAAKKMLADYQQAAKGILSPVKADIDTSGAVQSVETLKVKLAELEAQRKKAIKAGDTELSKSLQKQINQTKADIKGLDSTALKTSTRTSRQKKIIYADDSVAAQAKLVADLQKKWNEAGADVRDSYIQPLIEAEKKLKSMRDHLTLVREQSQGRLLGGVQSTTVTATIVADTQQALDRLREIDGVRIDPKTMTVTADTQQALDRLRKIDGIKIDDKTIVVKTVTEGVRTQDLGTVASVKPASVNDSLDAIARLREKIESEMKAENLKIDQNIFTEVFQTAIQSGINGVDITFSALSKKIAKGIDIPDKTWENLLKEINEKLEALGLDPITVNLKTGKISSSNDGNGNGNGKQNRKREKYEPDSVSGVIKDLSGNVGGILAGLTQMGIEVPQGLQDVIVGIQSVMTILTTISTILEIIKALQAVQSLPLFSHGGPIGRAAAGMLIPGNSNSGDNLRLPVLDTGGMIGVNSGELILNKSQQTNLANALEGGGMQGMNLSAQVSGEQIVLVANRHLRRVGKGELVTWK